MIIFFSSPLFYVSQFQLLLIMKPIINAISHCENEAAGPLAFRTEAKIEFGQA